MADANTDPKKLKSDLWKKMADSPFVMVGPADGHAHHEPLTAQLDQDQVDTLFFFIGKDNRLAGGGRVMAQYVSKGHDFFACLDGQARIDNDAAQIDKLWNNQVEAWFPGGRNDPNLALLRVDIDSAELWESDISLTGRVKMLFGGTITPSEDGSHAKVQTTAENTSA
ncbi:general stress protein [Sphingomonas sp. Leaf231]|uniref:pyridoxamine 5'-phosphate oxidase family protein n=1 Tax=Sphingomonas sp. Leaf231 TaxID=1736301 RepID=UPI0006F2F1D1|nr:pyridoxamine 5'-phosphate oxidase family protein [Sphingomonas sp. Leaf231]KQN92764.1 general stress protein [Sphingomonas sp. Leaf231]